MVNAADGAAGPAGRNWFGHATTLFFLAVVLGIGWDCYRLHGRLQELAASANEAVRMADEGELFGALAKLHRLRQEYRRVEHTSPAIAMRMLHGRGLEVDRQLAMIYRNLGHRFSTQQSPHLAVRAYTLALQHGPTLGGVAVPLAQECFFSGNDELGLHAARLAEEEGVQQAEKLRQLFRRRLEAAERRP
jgi:hypothetical protein